MLLLEVYLGLLPALLVVHQLLGSFTLLELRWLRLVLSRLSSCISGLCVRHSRVLRDLRDLRHAWESRDEGYSICSFISWPALRLQLGPQALLRLVVLAELLLRLLACIFGIHWYYCYLIRILMWFRLILQMLINLYLSIKLIYYKIVSYIHSLQKCIFVKI